MTARNRDDYPSEQDWAALRARYQVAIKRHHELERKLLGRALLAELIARSQATRVATKLKVRTAQRLRAKGRILREASAETIGTMRFLRGEPS